MLTIFSDSFKKNWGRKDTTVYLTRYFLSSEKISFMGAEDLFTVPETPEVEMGELEGIWDREGQLLRVFIPGSDLQIPKIIHVVGQNSYGEEFVAFVICGDKVTSSGTSELIIDSPLDLSTRNFIEIPTLENLDSYVDCNLVVSCSSDTSFLEGAGIMKGTSALLPKSDLNSLVTLSSYTKYSKLLGWDGKYADVGKYISREGLILNTTSSRLKRGIKSINIYLAGLTPTNGIYNIHNTEQVVTLKGTFAWTDYMTNDEGELVEYESGISELNQLTNEEIKWEWEGDKFFETDDSGKKIIFLANSNPTKTPQVKLWINIQSPLSSATSNVLEIKQDSADFQWKIQSNTTWKEGGKDLYIAKWKEGSRTVINIYTDMTATDENIPSVLKNLKVDWADDINFEVARLFTISKSFVSQIIPGTDWKSLIRVTFECRESNLEETGWLPTGLIPTFTISYQRRSYSFCVVQEHKIDSLVVLQPDDSGNWAAVEEFVYYQEEEKKKRNKLAFVSINDSTGEFQEGFWKWIYKDDGFGFDKVPTYELATDPSNPKEEAINNVIVSLQNPTTNSVTMNSLVVTKVSKAGEAVDLSNWQGAIEHGVFSIPCIIAGLDPKITITYNNSTNPILGITASRLDMYSFGVISNCPYTVTIRSVGGTYTGFKFYNSPNPTTIVSNTFSLTTPRIFNIHPDPLIYSATQDRGKQIAAVTATTLDGKASKTMSILLAPETDSITYTIYNSKDVFDFNTSSAHFLFMKEDEIDFTIFSKRSVGMRFRYSTNSIGSNSEFLPVTFTSRDNYAMKSSQQTYYYLNTSGKLKREVESKIDTKARILGQLVIGPKKNNDGFNLYSYSGDDVYYNDTSEVFGTLIAYLVSVPRPPKVTISSSPINLPAEENGFTDVTIRSTYPLTADNINRDASMIYSYKVDFVLTDITKTTDTEYVYNLRLVVGTENTYSFLKTLGTLTISSSVDYDNYLDKSFFYADDVNNPVVHGLNLPAGNISQLSPPSIVSVKVHQSPSNWDLDNEGDIIGSTADIPPRGEIRNFNIVGPYKAIVNGATDCTVSVNDEYKIVTAVFSKIASSNAVTINSPSDYLNLSRSRTVGFSAALYLDQSSTGTTGAIVKYIDTYSTMTQYGYTKGAIFRCDTVKNTLFVANGDIEVTLDGATTSLEFSCGLFDITKSLTLGSMGESPDSIILEGESWGTIEKVLENPVYASTPEEGNYNVRLTFPSNGKAYSQAHTYYITLGSIVVSLKVVQKGRVYKVINPSVANDTKLLFHASGLWKPESNVYNNFEMSFSTDVPASDIRVRYVRYNGGSYTENEGRIVDPTLTRINENTYSLSLTLTPNLGSSIIGNISSIEDYIAIYNQGGSISDPLWRGRVYQGYCCCGFRNPETGKIVRSGEISTVRSAIPISNGRSSGKQVITMRDSIGNLVPTHFEVEKVTESNEIEVKQVYAKDSESQFLDDFTLSTQGTAWSIPESSSFPDEVLEKWNTSLVLIDESSLSYQIPYVLNTFKVKPGYYYSDFYLKVDFSIILPYGDIKTQGKFTMTSPFDYSIVYHKPIAEEPNLIINNGKDVNGKFGAMGGQLKFTVSSNTTYTISISDDLREWVTQTEVENQRVGELIFEIGANNTKKERSGKIVIKTDEELGKNGELVSVIGEITIEQEAGDEDTKSPN